MDILKAVVFDGYTTRKDGSALLKFETGELAPSDVANLHALRNCAGVIGFSMKDTLSQKEIKDIETIDAEVESKTKSERLRNSLYILFTQKPEGFKDFKDFYADRMEKMIQKIKDKLEP